MQSLRKIIENLKKKEDVDAVFLTGSFGVGKEKPYSDLDLVIILRSNEKNIKSIYQWIDGVFSDIFFFDRADLERISNAKELCANSMDAIFLSWLNKASIKFDKTGILTSVVENKSLQKKVVISNQEKYEIWQKINYNFVANSRYFESNDQIYHEALEIRLLYSVIEIITGYFMFRDIPWRGEKDAVGYLKRSDPDFYKLWTEYSVSADLTRRFELYKSMFEKVFAGSFKPWTKEIIVAVSKTADNKYEDLVKYWQNLAS